MQPDSDILIVGGGMVGGSLSLALRHTGLKVTLIEAVPAEQRKQSIAGKRAIALSWGSRCLMQTLGLWRDLADHAIPIRHIHVSDRGHFGKTRLHADQLGVGALGYVATAEQIEQAIDQALAQHEIEVLSPARLTDVDTTHPGWIGARIEDQGGTRTLTARLIVGADGAQSILRQLGDFQIEQLDYQQTAITTMVRPERDGGQTAYERFTDNGPIALLPHFDGLYSVVWTQPADRCNEIAELDEAAFMQHLQQQFGYWLGTLQAAGPRQQFPLMLSRVRETVGPRMVLIGNAAHQLHPVAGQGFNLGLRDAAQLAECLGELSVESNLGQCLDRYAQLRRRDQNLISGFTDQIVRWFSNASTPVSLLRNSGLLLLDHLPSFKQQFARHTMGVAGRHPRLVSNHP